MDTWEVMLAKDLAQRAGEVLVGLTFKRLRWLAENFDKVVVPFLRGELDERLRGIAPLMIDSRQTAEDFMRERVKR